MIATLLAALFLPCWDPAAHCVPGDIPPPAPATAPCGDTSLSRDGGLKVLPSCAGTPNVITTIYNDDTVEVHWCGSRKWNDPDPTCRPPLFSCDPNCVCRWGNFYDYGPRISWQHAQMISMALMHKPMRRKDVCPEHHRP